MTNTFKLVDCHTHALNHGVNKSFKIEEMVISAIEKGLSGIILTDHLPLPPGFIDPTPNQDCAMGEIRYKQYREKLNKVITKYTEIEILRGAEVDYLPESLNWTKNELERLNLDYAIGSVHFIGKDSTGTNLILDSGRERFEKCLDFYGGIENVAKEYFKRVRDMVKSNIFNSIGHLDVLKKYNQNKEYFSGEEIWYQTEVLKTLDVIAISGMALELNTSGFIKCDEQYPSLWILKEAQKRKIPIIIGSDAHIPELIGSDFEKAINIARNAGFESVVYFVKGKIKEIKI